MFGNKLWFCLLVAVGARADSAAAGDRVLGSDVLVYDGHSVRDDIPQRCIDHSVTAVSCAHAGGAGDGDALLPHPDDCQLFYYCVSAQLPAVCRACPAGLHFSPTDHVCDRPEHAGCTLTTTTLPSATSESAVRISDPPTNT